MPCSSMAGASQSEPQACASSRPDAQQRAQVSGELHQAAPVGARRERAQRPMLGHRGPPRGHLKAGLCSQRHGRLGGFMAIIIADSRLTLPRYPCRNRAARSLANPLFVPGSHPCVA